MSAPKSEPRGALSALAGMVGFSALAGLLVTVMVTPALAITGMTANNTIGIFDSLPEFIEIGQQPERNTIVANSNAGQQVIATIYDQNREEVTYEQISPHAVNATVAGEDRRFFEHGGVDIASVVRAAVTNFTSSQVESGASTLSMQLVKNIYVQLALEKDTPEEVKKAYEEATATSFDRKLKEMKLAIGLEKTYSKKEILTAYLNIAFFGDNTYGIESAAQRYYSVPAKDLNPAQAASLIAIVQYPNLRGLDKEENFAANKDRRDTILGNMRVEGMLTSAEYQDALNTPVDASTLVPSLPRNGCIAAWDYAKFFCDYVVKNVKNLTALGADESERLANWKRGGYTIRTTLDMDLQQNAQEQTWRMAPNDATALQLGSATSSVEVGTGRILMMTENKLFNDSLEGGGPTNTAVNFNTDREYGGSSGFQPGSTYKVFTLINWLENGHGLNEVVDGSIRQVNQAAFTDTCEDGGGWAGPYKFKNDSGESGSWTVARATAQSVNSAFISMALKLDLCSIRRTAESLGVHRADGTHLQTNPSSVLGTNEIAPLTMAASYAGIANAGVYCEPVAIDSVISPTGDELPGQQQECRQALDPEVANTAAFAMAAVMRGGTGTASNPNDGIPIIGKTGTTDSSNQTWIVTATKKVATAVWVGNIVGSYPIRNFRAAGTSGGLLRHAIMKPTMAAANAKYGGGAFDPPANRLLVGAGATVPDVTGSSLESAKALLVNLGFRFADGGAVDSALEVGKVVSTSPGGGSRVSIGQTVTVYTSNGSMTSVPDAVSGNPSFSDARKILADAGFENVAESCVVLDPAEVPDKGDKVVSSSPAPGATAKRTDTVTLGVGKASC